MSGASKSSERSSIGARSDSTSGFAEEHKEDLEAIAESDLPAAWIAETIVEVEYDV